MDEVAHRVDDETDEHAEDDQGHGAKVATEPGMGPRLRPSRSVAASLASMIHEFHLPDIGEGLTEAEIVAWLVGVGDTVTVDQPIVEVETAKTTVEIPAPFDGTITSLVGAEGDVVAVGDVLFIITDDQGESTGPDVTSPASEPVTGDEPAPHGITRSAPAGTQRAMPAVRKLASELGVDLASVVGTGASGTITAEDVRASSPGNRAEGAPPGESTPLSPTRRAIAAHMTESWTTIPHVTVQAEIRAEVLLADRGIRADKALPLEPLVAMAVAPLLRRYPEFNDAYRDASAVHHRTIDMGFAVDTEAGLMVVVVDDIEQLSLSELTAEFERLATEAQDRTIDHADTIGQTFTISNIGALGGGHGTPIIPVGTSAIMSIGRAVLRPVVEDGTLATGMVAPIDLSYDHRLIDGSLGQRFLADLVTNLETPWRDR
jgi:2-oxoisovalerate dehydrogenase E2 component (dihydrolipoyl transacylase)